MNYYSTTGNIEPVSFRESLFQGLAPDGGLYLPEEIPNQWRDVVRRKAPFPELAFDVLRPFVQGEISDSAFGDIVQSAFSFEIKLVEIQEGTFVLELFHGPTLAFKDFGARFMARTMEYFLQKKSQELTILVATSGDTGSAVANGFYGIEGIRVFILYPKGRVSPTQEKQLTTLGGNISALEVEGSFDDCQRLVKSAFLNQHLRKKIQLSSANSINIARLLPQSVYYHWAYQEMEMEFPAVFSVPSGNFGNLTGGLIAKKMGLPVEKFIASTNMNNAVPVYLETGVFYPKPSVQTISNAMDVGNPSNLDRMTSLYGNDIDNIRSEIMGMSFNDQETIRAIRDIFEETRYILDPHTAVGYLGLNKYHKVFNKNAVGIILSTAHPSKFSECIEPAIGQSIPIPERLNECLDKRMYKMSLPNDENALSEVLLTT